MLLARTPGAAPGAAGISLFLVPNVLADGVTKNDVELISLNKKMGHRAITNCAWTLGARDGGAIGYLVGEEGKGLAGMFQMMNAMRIEVGLGAACLGKRGYLEALHYAQSREQGGKPIIEHADVKRMLLLQATSSTASHRQPPRTAPPATHRASPATHTHPLSRPRPSSRTPNSHFPTPCRPVLCPSRPPLRGAVWRAPVRVRYAEELR